MKFIHCDIDEFQKRRRGKKIICFGASQKLFEAVADLKLEEDVQVVVDNAEKKRGTSIQIGNKEIIIECIDDFLKSKQLMPSEWLILITSRFYEEIVKQLDGMKQLSNIECYAYPCLQLYIEEGQLNYFYQRLIKPILDTYDEILCYQNVEREERKRLLVEKKNDLLENMDGYNKLVIPRVVFSHWNKCNLNCEHCGAYMPDVEIPYHISSQQVLKDVDIFMRSIEECLMVDITDGEPLLNPELDILLNGLTENPKIKCVFFYTNGTYLPQEKVLKALEHPKVVVMISDYGFIEKMAKIVAVFEKRGINFRVMTDMYWMNTDSMEDRRRSPEFLKYHFLNCEAGRTRKRMAYGKLWTCTRSFRFHNLGLYESENDYVKLKESDSDEELRKKILKLYLADTADACNYCDYGNMAVEMVEAGVQKNKNIKKSGYTMISRQEYEKLMHK